MQVQRIVVDANCSRQQTGKVVHVSTTTQILYPVIDTNSVTSFFTAPRYHAICAIPAAMLSVTIGWRRGSVVRTPAVFGWWTLPDFTWSMVEMCPL